MCLLILLLFYFPAASTTIMRRTRREKSRRTYKNYLFEIKKIKFKYSGFSFLPATKKTSRINLNISLHFYFLLYKCLGEETGGGWNIKINKENYYWRISFSLNMNDKYCERKRRHGTASKDEKYFNHNRSRAFHTKNQFHMSQGLRI